MSQIDNINKQTEESLEEIDLELDDDLDTDVPEEETEDESTEEESAPKTSTRVVEKKGRGKKGTAYVKKEGSPVATLSSADSDTIATFQREDENKPDNRKLEIYGKLSGFQSKPRERIKTNILSLDLVIGELYRGEVVEISSPAGVGKSTLMMQLCKNIVSGKFEPKNPNGKVAYIDVEGGVHQSSLEKLGLDKYNGKQFQLLTASTYTDLEKILTILLQSEERFDAIIIDSITDVIPEQLYDKSINEIQIGLDARLMTTFIQKFKPLIRSAGTTLWLVNQMRVRSVKRGYQIVFEEDSAGPNIISFAPDVRLKLAKGEAIKQKEMTVNGEVEVQIGTMSEIWASKNRSNNVNIRVSMPIIYGKGISDVMTMKNVLFKKGFLTIGGASHTLTMPNEEPLKFHGSKNFLTYVKENLYLLRDKLEKVGHWKLINLGESVMI